MGLAARSRTGSSVAQVETSMSGVAGRYAVALFELASETRKPMRSPRTFSASRR